MNLSEQISSLQSRAEQQLHALGDKKKTENALLLPFFDALGYDPFDIRQVEPDYEVGREDPGAKTADYALKTEGRPTVLLQCTEARTNLGDYEAKVHGEDSLLGQFDRLEADVVAFTNGLTYRFYANLATDLAGEERPFLEFNLLGYESDQLRVLRRLSKPDFDRGEILTAAHDRLADRLLQDYLAEQRESPDDYFVRFLAAQVYDGDIPDGQLERFRPLVQEALGGADEDEDRSATGPPDEPDVLNLEVGTDGVPSGDGVPTDTGEEDGSGPFDKNLAQRVIDDA